MAFNIQGTQKLEVGEKYRILLRQRGRNSKNPWVAAELGDEVGKVKSESTAADGNNYLEVRFPSYLGTFLFRVDETRGSANGPVVQATLFLVL
jgi:hypothetical protein